VGLDVLTFEQTSLFHSDSCFNLGGLELRFGGAKPTKFTPVVTELCGKTVACFLMQLTRKSTYVAWYVKLSVEAWQGQSAQRTQVVSILLHEAKAMLGLFCLQLNTVGWSGHVTSTIRRGIWLGELLEMSWSTKQDMCSKLFLWLLQSCSVKGKITPAVILPHEAK